MYITNMYINNKLVSFVLQQRSYPFVPFFITVSCYFYFDYNNSFGVIILLYSISLKYGSNEINNKHIVTLRERSL